MKTSWLWYGYGNLEIVQEDTGFGREGVKWWERQHEGKINNEDTSANTVYSTEAGRGLQQNTRTGS